MNTKIYQVEDFAVMMRVGDGMHWVGQGVMDITAIQELPAETNHNGADYMGKRFLRVSGVLNGRRMTIDLEFDDACTFDTARSEYVEGACGA